MSVDAISSSTGTVVQCDLSTGAVPIGPDEIIAYVRGRLCDIDEQIEGYMDRVNATNRQSEDLRIYQEAVKGLDRNGTGYDSSWSDDHGTLDAQAVDCLEQAKAKISDPDLKASLQNLQNDIAADGNISHDVLTDCTEFAKDKLATINSDNEIIMMKLQSLIQLRTQIIQLCSNALASFNEGAKTTIGNIRG